jgi:protein-disulfide isomerase
MSEMNVRGKFLIAFLVVLIGLACSYFLLTGSQAGKSLSRDDARMRGNPDAPLTMIEYSDFTCGYCAKFFRETWPVLNAKYVQSGLVRFVYRDFPRASQGPGVSAAVAARCAGEQGQYWLMHDRLFARETPLSFSDFAQHAQAIGLNGQTFSACMKEERYLDAIFRDRAEGASLGLRGTPGFVLVPTKESAGEEPLVIPGAFPFSAFEEEIERLLSAVKGKG